MRADEWIARPVVSVVAGLVCAVLLWCGARVWPSQSANAVNVVVYGEGDSWDSEVKDVGDFGFDLRKVIAIGKGERVASIRIDEVLKYRGGLFAWESRRTIRAVVEGWWGHDAGFVKRAVEFAVQRLGHPTEIARRVADRGTLLESARYPAGIALEVVVVGMALVFAFSLAWVPGRFGGGALAGVCEWCGYERGALSVCPECGKAVGWAHDS